MPEAKKAKKTALFTGNILLEIAYVGTNYNGLAMQETTESHVVTILGKIIDCLIKSSMTDANDVPYVSVCGRTDAGVHARQNFISLRLRYSQDNQPYNYKDILNRMLSNDIRVVNAYKVPSWFNARFNCVCRSYKYYLKIQNLDFSSMQMAAALFLGEHNFINFAKIPPENQEINTVRTVTLSSLEKIDDCNAVFYIKSNAFLWHQIRIIVGTLIAVGKGQLTLQDVKKLLSAQKTNNILPMAHPNGLILWNCHYSILHLVGTKISEPRDDKPTFWKLHNSYQEKLNLLSLLSSNE